MQCHGRDSGLEKSAKPARLDGVTESNPHVRWCGRGDGCNPVTLTRLALLFTFGAGNIMRADQVSKVSGLFISSGVSNKQVQ